MGRAYGTTARVTRKYATHISADFYVTLCGRRCTAVDLIDKRVVPLEEATCKACQRVDDAQQSRGAS